MTKGNYISLQRELEQKTTMQNRSSLFAFLTKKETEVMEVVVTNVN